MRARVALYKDTSAAAAAAAAVRQPGGGSVMEELEVRCWERICCVARHVAD